MTAKADFNAEEWETLLEAPPAAGLLVVLSDRGGSIKETFSMAKAYTEAREQHGASQLLDDIVSAKPEIDRERKGSPEELKQHNLENLRAAIELLKETRRARRGRGVPRLRARPGREGRERPARGLHGPQRRARQR